MNKRLTTEGLTTPNTIFLLLCLAMIAVSSYLTNHFYEVYFPTGFESSSSSLCDFNAFWSCDQTTKSPLGKIFNVPTSFFGIYIGLIGIISIIFPSDSREKTLKTFFYLNALGCVMLLIYSLIILGGLCPMCFVYYILSWLAALLFYKKSDLALGIEAKSLGIFLFFAIVPAFAFNYNVTSKQQKVSTLSSQYVEQFKSLNMIGDPAIESPYRVYSSTEKFSDAPIRITLFSDFECPFCAVVAKQMEKVIKQFKGKINIQYMFYPLDHNCNKNIERPFHTYACMMAKIAACDKTKFAKIHDAIFEGQDQFSIAKANEWIEEFGLSQQCLKDDKVLSEITATIDTADQYNIKSTPVMIINGKKIEGTIPTIHLNAILKSLL